jgi:hypothetical protein
MLTSIAVRILPEVYQAFKRLMPKDERLPPTYEEWKTRSDADNAKRARGHALKEIVVHPKDFAEYCGSIGQAPSYFVLDAFASSIGRS